MYNHVETKSLDIWIKYGYRNISTEHKPLFLGWSYLRDAGIQSRGTLGSHWLLAIGLNINARDFKKFKFTSQVSLFTVMSYNSTSLSMKIFIATIWYLVLQLCNEFSKFYNIILETIIVNCNIYNNLLSLSSIKYSFVWWIMNTKLVINLIQFGERRSI